MDGDQNTRLCNRELHELNGGGVRRRRRPQQNPINDEMIRLILLVFQATNAEMVRLLESIIGIMSSRFGTNTIHDSDLRQLDMEIDCTDIENPTLHEIALPQSHLSDNDAKYANYLVDCVAATIEMVQRTRYIKGPVQHIKRETG